MIDPNAIPPEALDQMMMAAGQGMPQEIDPSGADVGALAPMIDAAGNDMGDNVIPFQPVEYVPPHVQELRQRVMLLQRLASLPNTAAALEETELAKIGRQVVREFQIDLDSRKDWEDRARKAMEDARQVRKSKSFPWEDASNVRYPLLTTAALQFAARAYPAIVDGPRIVKSQVMGFDPDGMKAAQADRVSQHMSYQLLYETDWESDTDTLLHMLPVVGCAFKKVYADGTTDAGFCDELVSAFDLVVNQSAKSLKTVPRITHVFQLYPHEIAERQRAGSFIDTDLKGEGKDGEDEDSPHEFLEQHRYCDLDQDGVSEPWIVTVHKKTEKVLKIRPGFDPGEIEVDMERGKIMRIKRRDYFVKVPFIPDPEGGFYDLGFGHLLEHVNAVIDTSINQMNDAATLQNAGGGFIGGQIDLGKGKAEIRIRPGEYRRVNGTGNDLRQSIYQHQHPGPSKTSLDLLQLMLNAGKDIAAVQDVLTGDMPQKQTATATMALIEQGLKVFTAIYKRIFRALKAEFRLIFDINKATLNQPKYVALLDQPVEVVQADYQGQFDICPVADPNNITDMQRMAKAQIVLEEVKNGNPHVNPFEATKRAFEAARIEKLEEVLVPPPPPDAPKEPSPEEKMAEVKIGEAQAQAQIKQQSAVMDLQAKEQEIMMKMEAKAREMEQRAIEAEQKHIQQLRDLQLQNDVLDQKWRELQVREEELKMKRAGDAAAAETNAN